MPYGIAIIQLWPQLLPGDLMLLRTFESSEPMHSVSSHAYRLVPGHRELRIDTAMQTYPENLSQTLLKQVQVAQPVLGVRHKGGPV